MKLYQSEVIVKKQYDIIAACLDAREKYLNFPTRHATGDMTWDYRNYNFFTLSSGSYALYDVYKELVAFVKSQIDSERAWMQCWLNCHHHDDVLGWHTHEWDYHGYICIDPKNTVTKFREYDVTNKIGQIYFGPGNREHKVECLNKFDDYRITIGYDISLNLDPMHSCMGMIPLV